ncbi:rust resistance kinase Lr10-like [Cryptomeria japonica]|uniref:rust resistance kinase Lr10-like n=1 Tax=Cryptomeria japonica TaxID=3369 RepID=UPI0027DA1BC3|nr:rust resistance kinase Lr10-like [Cryptomeria japonica]
MVARILIVVYRKMSSFFKGTQNSIAMKPMKLGSIRKVENSRPISKVENFLQSYIHQMPTKYSFSQLNKITNNFADKLGEGGFGVVYKGKLSSGSLVAVKLVDQSRQSENQFMNEKQTLNSNQLYSIALGTAHGIAKEDDHISIMVTRGTPRYVAPDVWNRNLGSVMNKSDVYSFGMVLLEIAGRRKNIDVALPPVSHSIGAPMTSTSVEYNSQTENEEVSANNEWSSFNYEIGGLQNRENPPQNSTDVARNMEEPQ